MFVGWQTANICDHSINAQRMIDGFSSDLSLLIEPTVQNRMNLREVVQSDPFMALGLLVERVTMQMEVPKNNSSVR